MKMSCSAIVLAGGNSERMNYPKPFLTIGGKTFLERICKTYFDSGIKNIYLVINKKFLSDNWNIYYKPINTFVSIIENAQQNLGRDYSIKLGAEKVKDAEYCFIQNIDNPFVSKEIISQLWKNKIAGGYTSPEFQGQNGHPILISNKIIRNILSAENENLRDVLNKYERKSIDVDNERILCNINTNIDYEKYIMSYELHAL